ncbi:hypothetical protein HYU22_05745 [Candidatus Woesearchaeota archaeon]|nr:hypothetical protein [Candidatus Woesearchaeota archaeon]
MTEPRKHFTIINKNAGGYSPRELGKLYDILHGQPHKLTGEIIATPDLSSLEYHLKRYKDFHPDILGIGGGDGTASQTLTLVQNVWGSLPEYIAPYALGTMNNWAIPFGLSDGLIDKVKQRTGVGDTKAVQLARYIQQSAEQGTEMATQKMALLDVNGRRGFNVGVGLVSKLVWLYYGKTIDQHRRLEEELSTASPGDYESILDGILAERKPWDGLVDLVDPADVLRRLGTVNALKTIAQSISGIVVGRKKEREFFAAPLEADFYIMDAEGRERKLELPPVTGIYIAAYEKSTLGLPFLAVQPTPEARQQPGMMQVVITHAKPLEIVLQIPALFAGMHLENTAYYHTSQLRIVGRKPMVAEVDADTIMGNELVATYDQTLKFVSMNGR